VENRFSTPRILAIIPPKKEPVIPITAVLPHVIGFGPGIRILANAPIISPTTAN